jgi:hypothetical protein
LTKQGLETIGYAIYKATPMADRVSERSAEERMEYYMQQILDTTYVDFDLATDQAELDTILNYILSWYN